MIQAGVEFHLVFLHRSFYPDASKVVFPLLMGGFFRLVEGECTCFGLQVQAGIRYGCVREANLSRNAFAFVRFISEVQT